MINLIDYLVWFNGYKSIHRESFIKDFPIQFEFITWVRLIDV